jgi:ABC-type Fe3+-hydroxamate transport system substrate-binding protein
MTTPGPAAALPSLRDFPDHLGRLVRVPVRPLRIVSLVPSQTELLVDLGVGERLVGVTKFCIHPPEVRRRAMVIGGTKQVDFEKIAALRPDLIIGNKEENEQQGIERLAQDFPVWLSDIVTLPDALRMIQDVGALVDTVPDATALVARLTADFAALPPFPPLRALYLIWRDPWLGAGSGTFIHEMLQVGGFTNVLADRPRYPELSPNELAALQPEVVLLSSEPYPFKEKHLAEIQTLCPTARVVLVDGEPFSWYGSRLLHTPGYLRELRDSL